MGVQLKIIRANIVSAIKRANITGTSVYPNRWLPTWEGELPAIFVYTENETVEEFNAAPREYRRNAMIVTEIIASADVMLDDKLDDFAELIEVAITNDPLFKNSCDDTVLKSSKVEMFADGDALMGSLQITWEVTYYERTQKDLASALPYLSTADIKMDKAPQDGVVDIESVLVLDSYDNQESLFLDGTKHISVPSLGLTKQLPPFALGKAATFSAWIKPTDLSQARSIFCCFDFSQFIGFEVLIGGHTLGQLGFVSGNSVVVPVSEDSGSPISTGKWTHIALTFDGVNVRFYRNGTLSSTVSRTALIGATDKPLFLGADTNTPSVRRFVGFINNFSVWNLVMTDGQVGELFATQDPLDLQIHSAYKSGNGVAWWQLMSDNDSVNEIKDRFGNNHGAAMNVVQTDITMDVP